MSDKMHKVAIVKTVGGYENYDDYNPNLFQTISEWEEVDDDTFKLLKKAGEESYVTVEDARFHVVEQLTTQSELVTNTVAAYVKQVKAKQAAKEKAAAEREANAEAKRIKALARDEKKRKELFLQLQQEFGVVKKEGV